MNKIFTAIAIPKNVDGYKKGDLIKYKLNGIVSFLVAGGDSSGFTEWQAHDIIFVGDDEPKFGDLVFDVEQNHIREIRSDYTATDYDKKIHFSTNPLHNLLMIPDSFKQVWVDRHGVIDEVSVQFIKPEFDSVGYEPLLMDGEIVVLNRERGGSGVDKC